MPGVAALTPARFALGLSADFRTTPGLIFFYSCSGKDCSDVTRLLAEKEEQSLSRVPEALVIW